MRRKSLLLLLLASAALAIALLAGSAIRGTNEATAFASPAALPLGRAHGIRVFLPGLVAIGAFEPVPALAVTDQTQLVRRVYDSYSRRSEGADGERATFTLGGFRTVYRPRLAAVAFYPDLATLGTDWELATVVRLSGRLEGGAPNTWFEPQWRRVENRAERSGAALLGRSARDIVALGAARFPERRRVVALTTYRVRASFRGRAVTYRAVARWLLDESGDIAFSIADNVVPEIGLAVGDGAAPESFVARALAERRDAPPSAAPAAGACVEEVSPLWSERWPREPQQRAGLSSTPRVEPTYVGRFRCSCDAACVSHCESRVDPEACRVEPAAGASGIEIRAIATAEALDGASPAGDTRPARCGAGLRCILVDCPDGSCGEVVTRVSVGATGLRFSTTAALAGDAVASSSFDCGRCRPAKPSSTFYR